MTGAGTTPNEPRAPDGGTPGIVRFHDLRDSVVRQVGQVMAAAAMTAPKSGGQLLGAGAAVPQS